MKPHALLIDDDPTVNFIGQIMMKHHDFSSDSRTFTNAEEALQLIRTLKPEAPYCIFLDLNMPIMDGWEFLEAFSKLPEDTKAAFHIFILTSSVSPTDREKAATYKEVSEFISKPLHEAKLHELKQKYFPGT